MRQAEFTSPSAIVKPGGFVVAEVARAVGADGGVVRVLLTGHADLSSALEAVNRGAIFRFLVKPCAPAALQQALGTLLGGALQMGVQLPPLWRDGSRSLPRPLPPLPHSHALSRRRELAVRAGSFAAMLASAGGV